MAVEKNYESDDFLIVNKPYDMYINSDDENEKNTLTCHIARHDSHLSTSPNPIHFVQRLDYSTSGVICIAKSKSAAAQAGKLFEKRLTKKYYLAIVRNHVKFGLADIHYAVGVDLSPGNSHKMVAQTAGTECGVPRAAHTRLLLLETGYYCGDPISVVLLKPITGRRHQLRVHCRAVEHIILGDYTYSVPVDCSPHRMFLHATRLVLPLQNQPLDIQTSEPFFTDPQFTCKWKPEKIVYKYRNKDDFIAACDVIDKDYTIGYIVVKTFQRIELILKHAFVLINRTNSNKILLMTEPGSGGAYALERSQFCNCCITEFYTNPVGCLVAIGLMGSVLAVIVVIVTLIQQAINPMSTEVKLTEKHV